MRMKGVIDEGKEIISPMFPRLHVKDAEKGGPKAPPRNKMALYEQFSIPSSQSFASGSASLFSLPLRNNTVSSTSRHNHVGSSQSIQFCTSSSTPILAEKIQAYNSRNINITKLMQDNFTNKTSLKALDGEDAFITSGSSSFKCLNPFRKTANPPIIELKATRYGQNHLVEHSEVSQIGHKPDEGSSHPLDGFGNITDASLTSLVKVSNSKSVKKEHRSLKEEVRSISGDSLKTFQVCHSQTHEEHAAFGDRIKLRDHRCLDGQEIGRRCFMGKRERNKDEGKDEKYDALNVPKSECILDKDISHDNALGVMGEKQFWKARRTMINQQRIFALQVFELHRLIEVQKLIAGSPNLLLEENLQLSKTTKRPSAFKKPQSNHVSKQPSSNIKQERKSDNPTTTTTHNKLEKLPFPCFNNISKVHINPLPNYEHHLGNPALSSPADINITKQPPPCVYPPPGNQWLVPVMSPAEGLVYKPIIAPCPTNPGFIAPVYSTPYPTMNFNQGTKNLSESTLVPNSGSSLPQFLPPFMHPPSVEQMGQSYGPDQNHHSSAGEANSAVLYQSSSNMSNQTSQMMSRNNVESNHSLKEKELQRSTASSPSKRIKGDVLPLFPVVPTVWPSTDRKTSVDDDDNQTPRVIKALPHNPKSATESAARIFRSIQEERRNM